MILDKAVYLTFNADKLCQVVMKRNNQKYIWHPCPVSMIHASAVTVRRKVIQVRMTHVLLPLPPSEGCFFWQQ
jgi:hypothetical protein